MQAQSAEDAAQTPVPPAPLPGWLGRWPWVTFVLPFAVFMLVGMVEPKPPASTAETVIVAPGAEGDELLDDVGELQADEDSEDAGDGEAAVEEPGGLSSIFKYRHYPLVYSAKILLTLIAMAVVWPGYRTFPWRASGLAVVVGVVGGVVWVGLCRLHLEPQLLRALRLEWIADMGRRSGFDPMKELAANPAWAYGFLALRFFGLVLIVPIIEEFFLRGFLMRFVVHDQWQLVPFGTATTTSLIAGTAYGLLTHTGELLAAAAWFSLISWLMVRTRNIWDCVIAHAITNLLMGAWVVWSGDWWMM